MHCIQNGPEGWGNCTSHPVLWWSVRTGKKNIDDLQSAEKMHGQDLAHTHQHSCHEGDKVVDWFAVMLVDGSIVAVNRYVYAYLI